MKYDHYDWADGICYPSQRSAARLLRYRVGARMRKDTAQGGMT